MEPIELEIALIPQFFVKTKPDHRHFSLRECPLQCQSSGEAAQPTLFITIKGLT
jgi:hypothetical protein